ncbi:MAG: hypothetical protein R3B53_01875 [Candidatus Paceibacterota bacterium]
MEVVTIDGVEYLKATQAAKRFKYTSDYIGQLCRGKKIDAKLVGRTWYINPLSLETHKKGLYTKNVEVPASEISIENKGGKEISRIDIEPVIRKETAKIASGILPKSNFSKRIDWKPVKYEPDTSELLPNLKAIKNTDEISRIKVDIADSEKITVRNSPGPTKMVADPLPTISLAGSLKIQSIDDDFKGVDFDNRLENIVKSEEKVDKEIDLKVRFKKSDEVEEVQIHRPTTIKSNQKTSTKEITESEATYRVDISHSAFPASFTPKVVNPRNTIVEKNFDRADIKNSPTSFLPYLLVAVCGLVCLLTVSFIEIVVLADSERQDFSFNISKIEL